MNFTPIIIIGAGRSGTNMLRDIITNIKGFATWDCDEINPIWRYGNKAFPTDELLPIHATKKIKVYIRNQFYKLHKKTNAPFIVEKTCANSLRLAYVYSIFPEAKFIVINRDGRDVVPSAMKRWKASLELKYTLKKLRYVPLQDFMYYTFKFGINRLKKITHPKQALSFWGPIYSGIKKDTTQLSLLEVCANQWQHCAEATIKDRQLIPPNNILDFKYEAFVNNPNKELERFSNFLEIKLNNDNIKNLVKNVSTKSVGVHLTIFNNEEQKKLNYKLKNTLKKLNY